jgi:hypothetical protein
MTGDPAWEPLLGFASWGEAQDVRDDVVFLCRRATPADYQVWLRGYLASGGVLERILGYPMPDNWFVPRVSLTLPALLGVHAVNLIVPPGVEITLSPGSPGHSTLHYLEGFSLDGGRARVVAFSDTLVYSDPTWWDLPF